MNSLKAITVDCNSLTSNELKHLRRSQKIPIAIQTDMLMEI